MIGPSRVSYDIAHHRHDEHLRHAAKIREIKQARRDGMLTADKASHRRFTALRLAGVLTALKATLHL